MKSRRRWKRGGAGGKEKEEESKEEEGEEEEEEEEVRMASCARRRDLEVYHSFLLHLVGHIHQLLFRDGIKDFTKYLV